MQALAVILIAAGLLLDIVSFAVGISRNLGKTRASGIPAIGFLLYLISDKPRLLLARTMGSRWSLVVMMIFALCLVGCGVPSKSSVKADFLNANPTAEVISVGVGEGDGGAAYFHIRYRMPNDLVIYEEVWQYLDRGGEKWQVNHRERISPPATTQP